jgi:hypothetical protein
MPEWLQEKMRFRDHRESSQPLGLGCFGIPLELTLDHVLAYRRIHHPRFSDLDKHVIVILTEMLPVAFVQRAGLAIGCADIQ